MRKELLLLSKSSVDILNSLDRALKLAELRDGLP